MLKLSSADFQGHRPTFYYEDDCGNAVKVIKNEGYFVVRILPADERLKFHGLRVDVPALSDFEGVHLKLDYSSDVDPDSEELHQLVEDINELVNHWVDLSYDLNLLEANPSLLKGGNTNITDEQINQYKLERLSAYPEMEDIIKNVFRQNNRKTAFIL